MTDEDIIREIKYFVETGKEHEKLDFKKEWSIKDHSHLGEFAKDVTAIANSPGSIGYLVYGVLDEEKRAGLSNPRDPNQYVVGFPSQFREATKQRMTQIATTNIAPQINISFNSFLWPGTDKEVLVVVIPTEVRRPFLIVKEIGNQQTSKVWRRVGSHSKEFDPSNLVHIINKEFDSINQVKLKEQEEAIDRLRNEIEGLQAKNDELNAELEEQADKFEQKQVEERNELIEKQRIEIAEKEAEIERVRQTYLLENQKTETEKRLWKEVALDTCILYDREVLNKQGDEFMKSLLRRKGIKDDEATNWIKLLRIE